MATPAAHVGCTGLVGSNILTTLLSHPSFATIHAFTRRDIPNLSSRDPHNKLHPLQDPDSSAWPDKFPDLTPKPPLFISSLGTNRAAAGSLAAQRAIDHDLNISLGRAAHASGIRTYVLISSAGVSAKSMIPYSKMKGEIEEAVQNIGFEKVVLLKPGLIVGERADARPAEAILRAIANFAGRVSTAWLKDFWAQDADVIARAAVSAGRLAVEGKAPEGGVWYVGQSEIIRLGRTEWKERAE
ncbi:MAG: Protein fmp52, mitochondrial [Alyxoria varia]|nr:MAG: Protein fmp52, mitochondrial [Alyxoria varia]